MTFKETRVKAGRLCKEVILYKNNRTRNQTERISCREETDMASLYLQRNSLKSLGTTGGEEEQEVYIIIQVHGIHRICINRPLNVTSDP